MLMCSDYLERPLLWIDLIDPACSLQLKYVTVNEIEGVRVTIYPRREAPISGLDVEWAAKAILAAAALEAWQLRPIVIYNPIGIGQNGHGFYDSIAVTLSDVIQDNMTVTVTDAVTFECAGEEPETDPC